MRWKVLGKVKLKKNQKRVEGIMNRLFLNRGLKTKKKQDEFLNPKNPLDLSLKEVKISGVEVKKAIRRIKKAIKEKEKIVVYGDYDADGVCGTAVLWEVLDKLGARAMPFIPKRNEGYGLKKERIKEMAENGVSLILTVDQGVVQVAQVKYAKKIGVDVIVTDHHVLGKKKPEALAIVHTVSLAGVGVAWFLGRELFEAFGKKQKIGLDLAAIGSITDMVSLTGVNRSMVFYGLKELRKSSRIGLKLLFQALGLEQNEIGIYEVGYIIGPRINASGRVKDPMDPLRLLCLRRDYKRALEIVGLLNENNKERQALTLQASLHAREAWVNIDKKLLSNLIFVQDETYNEGVIGLVAQKLTREFYRPAIVLHLGKKTSKASARSIAEFNIVEAIRACEDLLVSHGGHPLAAGFTIKTEKIDLLKTRLFEIAQEKLGDKKLEPTLKIDTELALDDLSFDFLKMLERFKPFGQGNFQPVFMTKKIMVVEARLVGAKENHLKLTVMDLKSKRRLGVIGFGLGEIYSQLSRDCKVDVAYQLEANKWNGQVSLQMKLKDIRLTKKGG